MRPVPDPAPAPELDPRVVLITAPDLGVARRLARALVDERLAACANLVPGVTSVYRWRGAVEEGSEVLLVVKTRAEDLPALERRVAELHPYDVPEIVALHPAHVEAAYLRWWSASTGAEGGADDAG